MEYINVMISFTDHYMWDLLSDFLIEDYQFDNFVDYAGITFDEWTDWYDREGRLHDKRALSNCHCPECYCASNGLDIGMAHDLP